jgi:hypothetical protein
VLQRSIVHEKENKNPGVGRFSCLVGILALLEKSTDRYVMGMGVTHLAGKERTELVGALLLIGGVYLLVKAKE